MGSFYDQMGYVKGRDGVESSVNFDLGLHCLHKSICQNIQDEYKCNIYALCDVS